MGTGGRGRGRGRVGEGCYTAIIDSLALTTLKSYKGARFYGHLRLKEETYACRLCASRTCRRDRLGG